MQLETGTIITGKITKITNFGAFIAIEGGGSGMVHISEISNGYVKDIRDHLTEGQTVEAVIITKDENGRLGLSMRKLPVRTDISSPPADFYSPKNDPDKSFEEMMHKFKSVSDEKMSDIKKGYDSKRGRYGKKAKH